ncbi:hypothetical protein CY35_10G063800 [Sphagnum magellanicum]|nr:hypothetical protein CY35_10G063800 [Sphagnum magellanicum]
MGSTAGPAYSMGSRTKWKAGDHRRGPGSYNPPPTIAKGPAFSMGSRTKTAQSSEFWERGPGTYDIFEGLNKRGPVYSFGIRGTYKAARSEGPGPGAYDSVSTCFTKTAAPSFSMGGRCKSNYNTNSPGPGTYDIARSTRSGPAFSISQRPADFSAAVPHARAYMNVSNTSTSSKSMTPGPGAYNIDCYNNVHSSAPAYSLTSKATHLKSEQDSTPGPGAYSWNTRSSGPAFTMALKRRDNNNNKAST